MSSPPSLLDGVWLVSYAVCLFILIGLFIFGCYYAASVFTRVGQLIADPTKAADAVDSIATMIEADAMLIPLDQRESIPVGRGIAILLLAGGYVIWAWIPLKILAVSGELLLRHHASRRSSQEFRLRPLSYAVTGRREAR